MIHNRIQQKMKWNGEKNISYDIIIIFIMNIIIKHENMLNKGDYYGWVFIQLKACHIFIINIFDVLI